MTICFLSETNIRKKAKYRKLWHLNMWHLKLTVFVCMTMFNEIRGPATVQLSGGLEILFHLLSAIFYILPQAKDLFWTNETRLHKFRWHLTMPSEPRQKNIWGPLNIDLQHDKITDILMILAWLSPFYLLETATVAIPLSNNKNNSRRPHDRTLCNARWTI